MRRALTWLAGAVGLAAIARHFSRRRPAAPATDPADELRRRLAERRDDNGSAEAGGDTSTLEPEEPAAPADPIDLEARRARVHARAQEAIELMRDGDTGDGPEDDATA